MCVCVGKRVAFSAGLGQTFTAPASGHWHDVKYRKVTLNHGGCYNPETGMLLADPFFSLLNELNTLFNSLQFAQR